MLIAVLNIIKYTIKVSKEYSMSEKKYKTNYKDTL